MDNNEDKDEWILEDEIIDPEEYKNDHKYPGWDDWDYDQYPEDDY